MKEVRQRLKELITEFNEGLNADGFIYIHKYKIKQWGGESYIYLLRRSPHTYKKQYCYFSSVSVFKHIFIEKDRYKSSRDDMIFARLYSNV